ncbi:MAG: sensor histidine kinase [Sarcina sp.]
MGIKSNVKEVSVKKKSSFDKYRKVMCWLLILFTIVGTGFCIIDIDRNAKSSMKYNIDTNYFRQLEVYQKLESFSMDIASDVLVGAYKRNPTEYIKNLNKNKLKMTKEIKAELAEFEFDFITNVESSYNDILSDEELKVFKEKQKSKEITEEDKYKKKKNEIEVSNEILKEMLKEDEERIKAIEDLNESMKKSFVSEKNVYDTKLKNIDELYKIAMEIGNKEGNVQRKSKVGYHLAKNVDPNMEETLIFKDEIYAKNSAYYTGVFFNNFMTENGPFTAYGPFIGGEISSGVYFRDIIDALQMVGYDMENGKYTLSLSADKALLTTGEFAKLYNNHLEYTKNEYQYLDGNLENTLMILGVGILLGLLLYKIALFRLYRKIPLGFVIGPLIIFSFIILGAAYYTIEAAIGSSVGLMLFISDLRFISKFGFSSRFEIEKKICCKVFGDEKLKKVTTGSIDRIVDGVKSIDKDTFKKIDFNKMKKFYGRNDEMINYMLVIPLGIIIFMVSIFALNFYSILVLIVTFIVVVIFVIGYILILCKNIRLKKELREIELATKKIVEGDFDISFDDGKISALNNIKENLVGIDKGFKIAIEDELKSEKMKAELITNVSHDLKTPLTSIISYVDLLQKEGITEDEKKAYIKILDHKSKRLKVLIEDLFEASKAATGNIKLNIENIDINSVLRQTLAEFKEKIDEAQLDFKITIPEHKVFLNLDGARTWRIFENLIGNALKYSMNRTRVYVDLFDYEDRVIFEIKNISGYELNCSPNELKERFKRADESRNTEGSGLGLAIANSLTELQGGRLDIFIDGDLFKVKICFNK